MVNLTLIIYVKRITLHCMVTLTSITYVKVHTKMVFFSELGEEFAEIFFFF